MRMDEKEEVKADTLSVTETDQNLNKSLNLDSSTEFNKNVNVSSDKSLSPKKQNRKNKNERRKSTKECIEKQNKKTQNLKKKPVRKRTQSFPAISKFFLPKRPRKEVFIPPTKFLLGGNISDPLNLNSLQDEDINRAMNAVTPKSSPLPTPPRYKSKIEVIIPPNINDPLNLMETVDNDEYEKRLNMVTTQTKKSRKKCRSRRQTAETIDTQSPVKKTSATTSQVKDTTAPMTSVNSETSSANNPIARSELKIDLSNAKRKRTASESEGKQKEGKKLRRMDSLDKIVSPVVPQPGAWKRHTRGGAHSGRGSRHNHQNNRSLSPKPGASDQLNVRQQATKPLPKFNAKAAKYQFGNYDRYYGYRNLNAEMDVRLKVFEMHRHLFNNKDILDIGCNVGHITIAIAQKFAAKSVTGIDIDEKLIGRARRNLQTFVTVPVQQQTQQTNIETETKTDVQTVTETNESTATADKLNVSDDHAKSKLKQAKRPKKNRKFHGKQEPVRYYFPASFTMLYGPIQVPGCSLLQDNKEFPHNVTFKQANYVLKDESLLNAETPQYDLILCLSTTKWFHLNFGDSGVKMAFKRMFAELRPGGKLILEAQNWASYKKKKKLTETIYKNFNSIEFFPNKFSEYLLSPEVGFSKCVTLGVPQHLSKGFRRPIQLYIKGDFTPSKAPWSDTYAPSSHHRPENEIQPKPAVYAATFAVRPSLWSDYTPSHGAATPYSPASCGERSPLLPSYSPSSSSRVYASLVSPGGWEVREGSPAPHRVYANLSSPSLQDDEENDQQT